MAHLFGTDGVRGVANLELTPELAFNIGRAHGYYLHSKFTASGLSMRPEVVVGRDTRVSGQLLEASYVSGLCSSGVNAVLLGVIPTPAVAWLVTKWNAAGGAVISASHNPVKDNGIKLLNESGYKLDPHAEANLEELLTDTGSLPRPIAGDVGRFRDAQEKALDMYVDYLVGIAKEDLSGLKIVLDCANGASSNVAPRVFKRLNADIHVLSAEPDGCNINENCGSTHLENLCCKTKELKADLGLAFDGDADRCLACDENGVPVDGDPMLLIFAKWLKEHNDLPGSVMVTTVMANLGLQEALEKENINMVRTAVGDKYVLAEMLRLGATVGGEQSGHIIFSRHATTGDGVLTGMILAGVLKAKGKALSVLAFDMHKKPQVLVNVKVKDKNTWSEVKEVAKVVKSVESQLEGRGRLLIRPSGTENLLRVMAEGEDLEELNLLVGSIRQALETYFPGKGK